MKENEFNDVNVAFFLSEKLNLDPYKSIKFSLKVAGELERRIKPRFDFDVKILNSTPIKFQFEVIKKGCFIGSVENL